MQVEQAGGGGLLRPQGSGGGRERQSRTASAPTWASDNLLTLGVPSRRMSFDRGSPNSPSDASVAAPLTNTPTCTPLYQSDRTHKVLKLSVLSQRRIQAPPRTQATPGYTQHVRVASMHIRDEGIASMHIE